MNLSYQRDNKHAFQADRNMYEDKISSCMLSLDVSFTSHTNIYLFTVYVLPTNIISKLNVPYYRDLTFFEKTE